MCLWVCVCYHNNSKLRASILTKLGLLVNVVSDHLQLIKFWPSHAHPLRNFLALPYYSQHAVFASPPSTFFMLCSACMHTLDIAPLHSESPPQKCSGMARVLKGSQFYLHTHTFIHNRNETYLPLPSSHSWYSFTDPGGMEG